MQRRAKSLIVTAGLAFFIISGGVVHQSYAAGSMLTSRLSRGDQLIWNSIRKIVLAKDRRGRLKHPKLYDLWCTVEASGHEVYIELIDQGSSYSSQAGKFVIEAWDPSGRQHICSIRLNLSAIRQAYARADAVHPDAFVPMAGLGELERYAEVLGHEMAHAAGILLDPDYLQLYQDLEKEVAEYERHLNSPDGDQADMELHLNRIKNLQLTFETPAEAAEAEIWHELRYGT